MINPIMKLAAIALTGTTVAASTAVAQVKLHQPVVRSGKFFEEWMNARKAALAKAGMVNTFE